MATPAAVLNILVRANTASANLGLAKVNAQARLTAKRFDGVDKSSAKTSKGLAGLGAVAKGGAVAGFIALGAAAKAAFDEFEESEKATKQTEAVIKSTGGAAKVTAAQIEELANQISLKSGIDDEAIQSGENLLLTFTKIRNETGKGNDIFNQSTQVITDMSVALGTSLKSAAIQVGKALQDPEKGITALRRVGVSFTTTQQDMITNWAQHGQQLRAQKFILAELTKEFGGSAAAQATSSEKLTVAWNNMLERFGKAFGPTLEKGMAAMARFINQMQMGEGAGGEFARTMEHVGRVLRDIFVFALPFLKAYYKALFTLIALWVRVGKTAVSVAKAIWQAMEATFNGIKKLVGDVIAGVLRRFATLFDVAAKIPGIGGKFKDLAADVRRSADRVDQLGEQIHNLPKKVPIKVQVDLLMKDFLSGDVPKLTPMPHGGPRDAIESGAKKRGRQWALDHLDRIAPLLGAPGSAPGTLGVWEQIGHRMGLYTSSGYRPGDKGFHGQNRARDLAGPAGAMLRYARFMYTRFGTAINELIHTPLGVGVDNHVAGPLTSLYPPATLLDHYDHVHVALQRGGGIPGAGSGDRVPALLEPGEFVVNRKAARAAGPMLERLNRGIPRFASGGLVAKAAKAAGFRGSNLLRAVAEAWGESGWNERAVGDGGASKGLMQIHTGYNPWARSLNLFDPFVNMRAAMRIFRSQGWGAWHADHRPGLARARAAIASISSAVRRSSGDARRVGRILTDRPGRRRGVLDRISPVQQEMLNGVPAPRPVINVGQPLKGEAGDTGGDALLDAINQQTAATEAHTQALLELRTQQRRNEDLIRAQGPALTSALIQMVNGRIGGNAGLGRQFPSSIGLGGLARV